MSRRTSRLNYNPPDQWVVSALDNLFEAAFRIKRTDGRPYFPGGALGRASKIGARDMFITESRYSNWCLGHFRDKKAGSQRSQTMMFIDVLSGQRLEAHILTGTIEEAKAIFDFWSKNQTFDDQRRKVIPALKAYASYLDQLVDEWELLQVTKRIDGAPSAIASDINPAVVKAIAGPSLDGALYSGIQANFVDDRTSQLFSALDHAATGSDGIAAGTASLAKLDFRLPTITSSAWVAEERHRLYGGLRHARILSPIECASLGLSVKRTICATITRDVTQSNHHFTSHTVVSRPRQGKSLVLAEIILRLCNSQGFFTLWSFDTGKSIAAQDNASLDMFLEIFSRLGQFPTRLVFLFDDFSKRPRDEMERLYTFQNLCRSYAEQQRIGISFILSADDARKSISPDENTIELRLEKEEEEELYRVITDAHSGIAEKRFATLDDLLAEYPEKRYYKDDVQSFIDFVRGHSIPLREFTAGKVEHKTEGSPVAPDTLAILAVSQVLDLSLPAHLAIEMVNALESVHVADEAEFMKISELICWTDKQSATDWSGFALPSAYRARSLLVGQNKLDRTFVKQVLSEIIFRSLEHAKADLRSWTVKDSEYVRHIFQRLAKDKLYVLPELEEKRDIADGLFQDFGYEIASLLHNLNDTRAYAKWAGTFSSLGLLRQDNAFDVIGRTLHHLCSKAVAGHRGRHIANTDVFVPLMRAVRWLLQNFRANRDVRTLAFSIKRIVDLDQLLIALAKSGSVDWERRANEVLHSYIRFISLSHRGPRKELDEQLFAILRSAEAHLAEHEFSFDAGNAAACAEVATDNKTCARYLIDASHRVRSYAREEGSWKRKVDALTRKFEERLGCSIAEYVERERLSHGPADLAL
jgi:hypothetical protein